MARGLFLVEADVTEEQQCFSRWQQRGQPKKGYAFEEVLTRREMVQAEPVPLGPPRLSLGGLTSKSFVDSGETHGDLGHSTLLR
jgi:hypothetical protein